MTLNLCTNPGRSLVRVAGDEAADFLQQLVTNDLRRLQPGRALFAGLLSPRGKLLADFVLVPWAENEILLDLHDAARTDMLSRLRTYRLRRKIEIEPEDGLGVAVLFGEGAAEAAGLAEDPGACVARGGHAATVDPRAPELGVRVYGPDPAAWLAEASWTPASREAWRDRRIALGVPEIGGGLQPDEVFPLEAQFEALNGVDYRKGCYVGQEISARMHNRTTLRRQVRRVRFDGDAPAAGTTVLADGKPAGSLLDSAASGVALAHLRLDRAEGAGELAAGGIPLTLLPDAFVGSVVPPPRFERGTS